MPDRSNSPSVADRLAARTQAVERKRGNESITFLAMARIYCAGHRHAGRRAYIDRLPPELRQKADFYARRFPHWRKVMLCEHCLAVVLSAERRTRRCPHMAHKTFCHLCPSSCYSPAQSALIAPLMRYSRWRLLLRHPVIAFRYLRGVMSGARMARRHRA